jgi:hypothetical protein
VLAENQIQGLEPENSGRERFLPSVEMTGMGYCCHSETDEKSFPGIFMLSGEHELISYFVETV